jgi:hypothetical protein
MKKITCTIAALLIGVFTMSAQQDSDVKAAKSAKKEVTKEVRQVQKAVVFMVANATMRLF